MSDFTRRAHIVITADAKDVKEELATLENMKRGLVEMKRLQKDRVSEGLEVTKRQKRALEREFEALSDLNDELKRSIKETKEWSAAQRAAARDAKDAANEMERQERIRRGELQGIKKRLEAEASFNSRLAAARRRRRQRQEARERRWNRDAQAAEKAHQAQLLKLNQLGRRAILADKRKKAAEERAIDQKRAAEEKAWNRYIVGLEAKTESERTAIARRGSAARLRTSRSERTGRSGASTFGGIGPNGGFGYLMGGGGVGTAIIGGVMAHQGISATTRAYLDQEEALGRLMSLVSDFEQQAGFTWDFARSKAQRLARTLGIDVTDAAIAMREAVTANVDPLKAGGFVTGAQGLALSEGVDVKAVTGMLAQIRNAFELTGEQMAGLPDIMFTAMDQGVFKLKQASQQIGDMAGIAKTVGFEYREALAAVSALTRSGMSSARAMTSIRALGELIMKGPTAKVAARRKEVGLDLRKSVAQGGLVGVIEDLKKATEGGQYNVAELLGGRVRALKGVAQLINQGNDDFLDILDKMYQSEGRAAREAAKLLDNPATRMKRLGETIETVMANIGETFVTPFLDLLGEGDDFTKNMESIVGFSDRIMHNMKWLTEGSFDKIAELKALLGLGDTSLTGFGALDDATLWLGDKFHGTKRASDVDEEEQAIRDAFARSEGYTSEADMMANLAWKKKQAKEAEKIKQDSIDRQNQIEEVAARERAERAKALAKEQSDYRKALFKEQLSMAEKIHTRIMSLEKQRRDFLASEAERTAKADLAGRKQTELEKFARLHGKYSSAKARAQSATDPADLKSALASMSEATSAMRGMDLNSVLANFGSDYLSARTGLAGNFPETPFSERYENTRSARNQLEAAREFLRSGRRTRGGLDAFARINDRGVYDFGSELYNTIDTRWSADEAGYRRKATAIENFDPSVNPQDPVTWAAQQAKAGMGAVDGQTNVQYNQPIEINLTFNGPADPAAVEDAATKAVKDAMDRKVGHTTPNK